MDDTYLLGTPAPALSPPPQDNSHIIREELRRIQRAIERLDGVEQAARARRVRTFVSSFVGSAIGRLLGTAVEKFLAIHDWFGFFG